MNTCSATKVKISSNKRIGTRNGMLVIIAATSERRNGNIVWLAKCDCGEYHKLQTASIKNTKSCGCIRKTQMRYNERADISGLVNGKLVVLWPTIEKRHSEVMWTCLCECGKIVRVRRSSLVAKKESTKSCGCLVVVLNPLPKGETGFNTLYNRYKVKQGKDRNLSFLLSKEEFKKLVLSSCFYCGQIPSNIITPVTKGKISDFAWKNGKFTYNGLDRLNNKLGYILNNCVPCCKPCNYAKNTMTFEEFKMWAMNVAKVFLKLI